jgi:diguanylate cyclase
VEPSNTFITSGYKIGDMQLFHGINEHAVSALLKNCPVIHLSKGKKISDGDHRSRLYLVLRGALAESTESSPADIGSSVIHTVLPGECLGELSVLDEEASSAAICALEDSDVLVLEAEKVWLLIDEFNGIARNLLRLLSFRVRAANAQLRRRQKLGEFYRQLSMVDGLTGLQNRVWLNDHLPELITSAHAASDSLSIIMIDLDHFKQFNDEHGHLSGDTALQAAAKVLTNALRPTDFAARYGGEELMVILPHADQKASLNVAERLCERMQQSVVFKDMKKPLPHITASFGIATLNSGQTADELIAQADLALYRAKSKGRNCVSA